MVESRGHRGYRNPSIEEAIVEFQFARIGDWDASLSGKLHQDSHIAKNYPATPRNQKLVQWDLRFGEEGETSAVNHEINRVQLLSPDGKRVITVGDHVLGVSTLRPYDGWPNVRERVAAVLNALCATMKGGSLPPIARIGVRYINRLVIPPAEEGDLTPRYEEYFHCGPKSVASLPPTSSFLCRTTGTYGDGSLLTSIFAPYKKEPNAFLLDINITEAFGESDSMELGRVMKYVDTFHGHVTEVFEASIKKPMREILNAPG